MNSWSAPSWIFHNHTKDQIEHFYLLTEGDILKEQAASRMKEASTKRKNGMDQSEHGVFLQREKGLTSVSN